MMYKGIILAGGSGTRLHPSSLVVSKQLMNVYDKPLIYYPLCTLMIAGIKDILIITNEDQVDQFKKLLGNGMRLGINITYKIQDKPNGLPEAFVIAEDFIGDDNVCMVLGDNIIFGNNLDSILQEAQKETGATILSYPVKDPERFGVIEFDGYDEGDVVSIEEKPEHPKSNRALIGIYFFDNKCIEYAKQLKPSKRGEFEITDLNQLYLEKGMLRVSNMGRGYAWLDTGTHQDLHDAGSFVRSIQERQGLQIACPEEIAFEAGWIDKNNVLNQSERFQGNPYGVYLIRLINQ